MVELLDFVGVGGEHIAENRMAIDIVPGESIFLL